MRLGRKTLIRQLYNTTNEGAKLAETNVRLAVQRDKARREVRTLRVVVGILLAVCAFMMLWRVL